jgi:hypothetical protein
MRQSEGISRITVSSHSVPQLSAMVKACDTDVQITETNQSIVDQIEISLSRKQLADRNVGD